MQTLTNTNSRATRIPSLILIGASQGGFDAVSVLLKALPEDYPATLIIVLHRAAANADSVLCQQLQQHSALLVSEPQDKEPILQNRVYLAPADYHLLFEGDHFALSTEATVNHARPAIDLLFESAARSHGSRCLALVLTGNNSDGANGAACIAAHGGQVWLQSPDECEASSMPNAAHQKVLEASVLPLAKMVTKLTKEAL